MEAAGGDTTEEGGLRGANVSRPCWEGGIEGEEAVEEEGEEQGDDGEDAREGEVSSPAEL